jgi:hypothetical protein
MNEPHRLLPPYWGKLILLSIVVCIGLAIVLCTRTYAAPASEKRFVRSADGYVCELTIEGNLGKSVCRLPREFANYYLVFIEFNYATNRVFIDEFRPTPYDDIMMVKRTNMTIDEFDAIYGP